MKSVGLQKAEKARKNRVVVLLGLSNIRSKRLICRFAVNQRQTTTLHYTTVQISGLSLQSNGFAKGCGEIPKQNFEKNFNSTRHIQ